MGGVPGSTGTCALMANSLAVCFLENMRMVSAVGPRKATPAASISSTNSAFSDRNP